MKSQVIPAQITTVEDKIVGNLNFLQLVLLITPVIWLTLIYALLPPTMEIVIYKLVICLIASVISLILALRIKGQVLLNWLLIVARYNLRPKYYLFDKNDLTARQLDLPKPQPVPAPATKKVAQKVTSQTKGKLELGRVLAFDQLLQNGNLNLRFKFNKKGGLDVAFQKIS